MLGRWLLLLEALEEPADPVRPLEGEGRRRRLAIQRDGEEGRELDPEVSAEILRLSEMTPNQSGDLFAVLASKEESQTKDGKPYYRVAFRDAKRKATSMIWSDHGHFPDCSKNWQVGTFYKLRGKFTENSYGPQIDIEQIRPVEEADAEQGFSADDFFETSRYDREEMFDELLGIAQEHITEEPLQRLVVELLTEHADTIKHHAAASRNHHAFMGGYLEHTLSVTRTAVFFAEKYSSYYTRMQPPISKSLVVAGAIVLGPRLGMALFFTCVVFGQVSISLLIDRFGWFEIPMRELNFTRILGTLLVIGGIILIQKEDLGFSASSP